MAAWVLAGLAISVAPASAEECNKPLRMLTSLPMTPLENSELMSVPVAINGVQKQFLFDTGGVLAQVSPAVVDELKLPRIDSAVQLYSVNGAKSDKFTRIENFALGKLPPSPAQMQISPLAGVDGILSPMIFKSLDFDMDFAARKLNILLSDHCEGKVIYWPAKAIAVVPFTPRDNHITVPVTIDDHTFTAVIDTGASTSTMRLDVAQYVFKLMPDSPDLKAVGHIGADEKALVYTYPFKSLSFEGIAVTNPKIRILTDIVNKNADHGLQTGSHIKRVSDDLTLPEVIIGMDVLSHLHPYLAMGEKRLYLTEATTPAATKSAASPTP